MAIKRVRYPGRALKTSLLVFVSGGGFNEAVTVIVQNMFAFTVYTKVPFLYRFCAIMRRRHSDCAGDCSVAAMGRRKGDGCVSVFGS